MELINKDILEITEGIIIVPVNCSGNYMKGLGSAVAKIYKPAMEKYRTLTSHYISNHKNKELLGTIQMVPVTGSLRVCNCYTHLTNDSRVPTDYNAIANCFSSLKISNYKKLPVYIEYGMCEKDGATWHLVEKTILNVYPDVIICKY